jgi:Fe-S-cluster-containing dehydrogenase component
MKITRKGFLRLGGVSVAALAAKKFLGAMGEKVTPRRTRRWAMVIDAAKCIRRPDCTKCSDACNQAHNVPVFHDPRHEVKWIWKTSYEDAFAVETPDYAPQGLAGKLLPVLCNHCENPPCVRVCPTQATWKREDGIVMMDWHRCIGCRYCVAACPYGSRSFNWMDPRPAIPVLNPDFPTRTKGVVEKCTFCEERLAKGQSPLCVDVCPEKALTFGDLNDGQSAVRELLRTRYTVQRKPGLGTRPSIFYIV